MLDLNVSNCVKVYSSRLNLFSSRFIVKITRFFEEELSLLINYNEYKNGKTNVLGFCNKFLMAKGLSFH